MPADLRPRAGRRSRLAPFSCDRCREPLAYRAGVGCPALEQLVLPAQPLDLTPLRHLPKLRRLSTRSSGLDKMPPPAQTAEEFWKEYDAQPKPTRK